MDTIFTKIKTRKQESFVVLSEKKRKNKLLKNKLDFENKKKLKDLIKDLFFVSDFYFCFEIKYFKN